MPLLDEGAELVSGNVEAVVVRVAVVALDFLALDSHLSPGLVVSVLVKITERDLENATTERISWDLYVHQIQGQSAAQIDEETSEIKRANLSSDHESIALQRSAHFNSKKDLLCPAALLHGVKVGVEMSKLEGTRTLYHSFLMKG